MRSRGLLAGMVGRSSRVYVTLDFESQILCVDRWRPVPFQDLKHVEPLTNSSQRGGGEDESSTTSLCTSTSDSGAFRRPLTKRSRACGLLCRGGCGVVEKHGFVLQTIERKLTCLCASELDAEEWVARLRDAMSSKQAQASHSTARWAALGTQPKRPLSGRVGSAIFSNQGLPLGVIKGDGLRNEQCSADQDVMSI